MKFNLAACLTLVLSAPVLAQQPAPNAASPDPLAGRPVEVSAQKRTLVERDFQGELRHPEPTAIEAAIALLDLRGEEKDRVDEVFTRRALILDRFVENNLDLLTRFGNAEHSTDGKEKFLLAVEAFGKLAPLRREGPLDQQVREALSPANASKFDALLRGYWNALAADDAKLKKPKGRLGVIADSKLKDLGKEIESAFHRAEKSGGVLYGYLFKSMKLTEDQSRRLHDLCATYSVGGLDNKDKASQAAFFLAVTQVLDKDQRRDFVKRLQGKK